jgi:exoribonuclease-2
VVLAGTPRLLLLVPTGDIWPISPQDVQFVMPASLVSQKLSQACWSTELLEAWSRGEETTGQEGEGGMMDARRQVVMVLRKVSKETEKMCSRLLGGREGGGSGGIESLWETLAPPEPDLRGSITAAQVAEHLLNLRVEAGSTSPIKVRPNTLPAYAAHTLLMRRPDLFVADPGELWDSGAFLVRSRAERARLRDVTRWIEGATPEDKAVLDGFLTKARDAIQHSRQIGDADASTSTPTNPALPEWTEQDLTIIHTMIVRLFETRSVQQTPTEPVVLSVLKSLGSYPGEIIDQALLARFLRDIGMMPVHESLEASKVRESEIRAMALHSTRIAGDGELLSGNELDDIRDDLTAHKVFVIDDPTATELDDGISMERLPSGDTWVHIHVADPTRYLPPSHPLAVQASFRGSALYLPEGQVPLLSFRQLMEDLSLGAAPARDNGVQGVVTFSALLSSDGALRESKVRIGWIKNPRVVTYGAVDDALGVPAGASARPFGVPTRKADIASRQLGGPLEPSEIDDLRALQELATKSRSRRMANAGLDWSLPTASLSLLPPFSPLTSNLFDLSMLPTRPSFGVTPDIDYSVPVPSSTPRTRLSSNQIVAEMMILAGQIAASFCSDRGIPVPYRGTDKPQPVTSPGAEVRLKTVEDLLALRDPLGSIDPFVMLSANILQRPSTVAITPQVHWTMGLVDPGAGYVRATSPLRRYEDLLVHWQLKAALASERGVAHPKPLDEREVEALIHRAEPAAKRVKRAGSHAVGYWQAGLISSRMTGAPPSNYVVSEGEMLDLRQPMIARISGQTNATSIARDGSTPVYIPSLGASARLSAPGSKRFEAGQEVTVKVERAEQWPAPLIVVREA